MQKQIQLIVFLLLTMVYAAPAQVMRYIETKATTLESGFQDQKLFPVKCLEVKTSGSYTPLTLLQFSLQAIGKGKNTRCTFKVFYSGSKDSFSTTILFASIAKKNSQIIIQGEQELHAGSNFFWIAIEADPKSDEIIPDLQFISCTTGLQQYQTAWADEFNVNGPPDTTNWQYEKGFVRNEEDQWYQPKNAFCKNGVLTIEARRDSFLNPRYEEGSRDWRRSRKIVRYTSASINTRGKKQWTYGRWEMKARLDTNGGCWPAWWALGTEGGSWPSNGEIDMMEFYRGKILANYAVATAKPNTPKWYSTATPLAAFNKKNWTDSFHQWRMDWDSAGIAIYLDEVLLNYQPQSALYNRTANNSYFPFRHPQYMLLNFALGGQNGGDLSGTTFPRRYDVDYVRVLQKVKNRFVKETVHSK